MTARLRSLDRGPAVGLAAVLVLGAGLRLAAMLAQRPAFLGYPDSQSYLLAGGGAGMFGDVLRPSGYPMFLAVVHAVSGDLSATTLVQHGLGLLAAAGLFLAARVAGAGRWWPLLPAGVVGLGGAEVMLEHAALSEALFAFLQAAAILAALLAARGGRRDPWLGLLAGLLVGYGGVVRSFGLVLVPLVPLWMLAATPGRRARLLTGGAGVLGAVLVLGAYVLAQHAQTGFTGYTKAGGWNLYGRAAVFADCRAFTPPAGTRVLCQRIPPARRPGPNTYIFDARASPAARRFGVPFFARDADSAKLTRFARAAFLHQPLDWLSTVVRDELPRYWDPDDTRRPGEGLTPQALADTLVAGQTGQTLGVVVRGYSTPGIFVRPRLLDRLRDWERVTRIQGPAFAALVLLALLGMVLGARRRAAALLGLVAAAGLLAPPVLLFYDARYTVPALGPLAAAAAVGGHALTARISARRRG